MVSMIFGKLLMFLQRQQVRYYMRRMHVGKRVRIRSGLLVFRPSNVTIEDGVTINVNCVLQAHAPIRIGRHTLIAANCTIVTATHDMSKRGDETRLALSAAPVTIGHDCWLGEGVTVLPGVTIGDGAVVGAWQCRHKGFAARHGLLRHPGQARQGQAPKFTGVRHEGLTKILDCVFYTAAHRFANSCGPAPSEPFCGIAREESLCRID
ncbi:MAG TPA: DapH/DapD/GlmU-related protein [Sedimentisphaerales bacterium]|nr:DapH/DapD/GlmU-related protein [Sedimentisphaerales bacterium]